MRTKRPSPLLLLTAALALAVTSSRADTPDNFSPAGAAPLIQRKSFIMKEGHFGEGRLVFQPGVAALDLHGLPYEMGYQYGSMLKEEIRQALARAEELRGGEDKIPLLPEKFWSLGSEWSGLPEELRQELRGMADGAGAPVWDLAWLDGMYRRGRGVRPDEDPALSGPMDEERWRRAWQEAGIPGWVLVARHPEGKPAYITLSRLGSLTALAGMRASGCCAVAGPKASDPAKTRRDLSLGLCNQSPRENRTECSIELADKGGKVRVDFLAGPGWVCVSRPGRTAWAYSIESSMLSDDRAVCPEPSTE